MTVSNFILDKETTAWVALKFRIQEIYNETDEEVLADTLEGETNLLQTIENVALSIKEDGVMAKANKELSDEYLSRSQRFAMRAKQKKLALVDAIKKAQMPKYKLTFAKASISVCKGRTKIVVDDVDALPQGYYTTEKKADTKAIKATLDAGEAIPSAHFEKSPDYLVIRTK